jgi:hypothetical protein
MARWFDRYLRESPAEHQETDEDLTLFVRSYAPPAPAAPTWAGRWVRLTVGELDARTTVRTIPLADQDRLGVVRHGPDLGLSAWNSCAGALPWGQPGDQRADDDRALAVDQPVEGIGAIVGNPSVRLRVRPERSRSAVAVRLCAVAADGTSMLVARGLVNLSYRGGLTGTAPLDPSPVVPAEWLDVEVELEACAYEPAAGERLRVAVAVTEWPNAVAPPEPQGLTVDLAASALVLPVADLSAAATPALPVPPATDETESDPEGDAHVRWWTQRDVLAGRTSAHVDHGGAYVGRRGSTCREHYTGSVEVDDATWEQRATASTRFEVAWPEVIVTSTSTLDLVADEAAVDVTITLSVEADGAPVLDRVWRERIPRDLG